MNDVAATTTDQAGGEMASKRTKREKAARENLIAIRLTDDELARIDRYADALAVLVPGSKANRSAAVRAAVLRGLDVVEAEARRTRGGE